MSIAILVWGFYHLNAGVSLQIILPLIIAALMLGIGMSLSVHSFSRLLSARRAAAVAFFTQFLILPLLAFVIASIIPMRSELQVGLVLVAACPSASTSNLFTYLARGDTALSISLTAFNKIFALLTIPIYVNFAITFFAGAHRSVTLSFYDTFERLMLIILLPIIVGMVIHYRFPVFTKRTKGMVKKIAIICLILLIAWLVVQQRHSLLDMLFASGLAVVMLCVFAMCCGYGFSTLFKLPDAQRITITLETVMQSGGMAIVIAAGVLDSAAMAIPAAMYSLMMYVFAGAFVLIQNTRVRMGNNYSL